MPQPKRKLPQVSQEDYLSMLGASVPQGAAPGVAAPMELSPEDYARFGIDPATGVGSGQLDLLPPELVASILNAEDAVTGDTVGNYVKGSADAFTAGTKKMARGMGQLFDDPDSLSGLTAWEAQRDGGADGNFDKYNNTTGSGILNMLNGGIEAVSAPAAPLFAPAFETGLKQMGVEGNNLSDTMLGRNVIEPVAEMTGIEPQAVFDTTLNAAMAAPFAGKIGRGAVKGAHRGMDMVEDGLFRDYDELFPEYRDEKNRTALGLADRVGNATLEALGTDPSAPGYAAPWVKPGVDEAGREIRPMSRMLPDMVDRIPALDNVPLPSWIREAPRAQGELSPWLQDNHQPAMAPQPEMPPLDQPSMALPSPKGWPKDGHPYRGETYDIDPSLPKDVQTRVREIMKTPGEYALPDDATLRYQAEYNTKPDFETPSGKARPLGEELRNPIYYDDEYPTLEQHWGTTRGSGGGNIRRPSTDRERLKQAVADIDQQQRTTLDQVPDINSNQGPGSEGFFSNLMREADRRDADPFEIPAVGRDLDAEASLDAFTDTANQNLSSLQMRLANGGDFDQAVAAARAAERAAMNDGQGPIRLAGFGPDSQPPVRLRGFEPEGRTRARFFNEDGTLAGSRQLDDVESLADYEARQIYRQDQRAGLPDKSKLDQYELGRSDEYNRNDNVFGNYDMTRAPEENGPYANAPARLDLEDMGTPEDLARYDYLRNTLDPWRERQFERRHGSRDRLSPEGQRAYDIGRQTEFDNTSLNSLENASDNKARDIRYARLEQKDRALRRKAREAGAARRAALGDKANAPPVFDGEHTVTFGDGGKLVRTSGREAVQNRTRSQTFDYSHPDLPSPIQIELDTLSSGRTITTIMGDADTNAGVLGAKIVRDVARAIKTHFKANNHEGTRATGIRAGKGLTQRTRFANGFAKPSALRKDVLQDEFGNPLSPDASVRDAATAAVRGSGKPKQPGEITTLSDGSTFEHITDIVYSRDQGLRRAVMEYKKPGMENSVEVMLTVGEDGAGHIDILGDNDHIGAFGNKTVREAARWLREEYGVTKFEGWRTKRADWDEGKQMQSLPATRFANGGGEKPSVARQRARDQKGEEPAGFETPDVESGTVREAALQALRDQRLADMDPKKRKGINPKRLPASEEAMLGTPLPQKRTGGTGRGKNKAQDGIMATPNLRDMNIDEALSAADSEPHLMQDKSGQYIGGPRGLMTRKQLMAMRKKFDEAVDRGLLGANWYQRARDMNTEINSGAERQSMASKEQAHTSAQAAPDPNFNWALQLRNDYEAGAPASRVRTGRVADSYMNARARGGRQDLNLQDILGKKTGIYGEHLDPNVPFATTGTNDIHHARQFGYTNSDGSLFSRALTEQEHRFLDYETLLAVKRARARHMGGRTDWNAAEIQAAPWTSSKGELIAERSNGKITPEQGREMAGKTYPDFLDKYTANVTGESWPSQGMQMFPEWDMSKATPEERMMWDQQGFHYDEGGRDPIYSQTFGLNVRPTQRTVGSFEGQNNPVDVSRPLVHFENEGGKPTVGKSAKNMLNMDRAAAGLMDTQDGSAWHKVVTQGPGSDKSSLSINMGRVPNTSEMQALEAIASKYGFGLANANNGVSFLDFAGASGKDTSKKLTKGMKKEIEDVVGPAQIQRGRFEGGYHDLSGELKPENQGQGLATKKTMDAIDEAGANAPNAKNALLHSKAAQAKAASNLKRILETEATRGPARADVKKLLDILAKGGWKGLYDHVQKFGTKGLPAVALPLLLQQGAGNKNERQTVDMSTY